MEANDKILKDIFLLLVEVFWEDILEAEIVAYFDPSGSRFILPVGDHRPVNFGVYHLFGGLISSL